MQSRHVSSILRLRECMAIAETLVTNKVDHKEAISDWNEAIRIGEQTGDKEAVQKATASLAELAKPK